METVIRQIYVLNVLSLTPRTNSALSVVLEGRDRRCLVNRGDVLTVFVHSVSFYSCFFLSSYPPKLIDRQPQKLHSHLGCYKLKLIYFRHVKSPGNLLSYPLADLVKNNVHTFFHYKLLYSMKSRLFRVISPVLQMTQDCIYAELSIAKETNVAQLLLFSLGNCMTVYRQLSRGVCLHIYKFGRSDIWRFICIAQKTRSLQIIRQPVGSVVVWQLKNTKNGRSKAVFNVQPKGEKTTESKRANSSSPTDGILYRPYLQ